MALISYEQAAGHLRLPVDGGDEYVADVTAKMEQATALVLKYAKIDDAELSELGWTEDTDASTDARFAVIQAAIFEVLANLFSDRGDRERPSVGPITPRLINMLSMWRSPTIA